jgi:hypothetical protein
MSYYSGWSLASDQDFMNRVGFCAETEGLGFEWGIGHRMEVAAAPGFAEAYESAVLNGVENPGRDQAVISDGQILSAVQAVAAPDTAVGNVTREMHLADLRRMADDQAARRAGGA